jgi:hypothetical protein
MIVLFYSPLLEARPQTMIYFVGAMVLVGFHSTWFRLRSVQLRLADLQDRLDEVAGAETEHHVESEIFASYPSF